LEIARPRPAYIAILALQGLPFQRGLRLSQRPVRSCFARDEEYSAIGNAG